MHCTTLNATRRIRKRGLYNFAVAGIFSVVRAAKLDPWTQPIPVGANNELMLAGKKDSRPDHNPSLYDLIPTDEIDFHGTYVKDDVQKEGIGAPLVASVTGPRKKQLRRSAPRNFTALRARPNSKDRVAFFPSAIRWLLKPRR